MNARVQWGLEPEAIEQETLRTIADVAAGDARGALSILRSAARHADRERGETITDEIVEAAIPSAQAEVHQKNVDTLTPHQRVLYNCITEHGSLVPAALYDLYRAEVAEPKSDRTVRNYLQKLEQYDLIAIEGTSRDRIYRRVAR